MIFMTQLHYAYSYLNSDFESKAEFKSNNFLFFLFAREVGNKMLVKLLKETKI